MKTKFNISDFFDDFYVFNNKSKDFYLDLHLHTTASDGSIKVEDLAKFLKNRSYLVAIADHNEIKEWHKLNALGIKSVPAIELGCEDGFEILVYFKNIQDAENFYNNEVAPYRHKTRMARTDRDIFTYLKILKNYQCHISIPHIAGLAQKNFIRNKPYILEIVKAVDSIEIYNNGLPKRNNRIAEEIQKEYNKSETLGSDAHTMVEIRSYFYYLNKRKTGLRSFIENINKIKVISGIGLKHLRYMLKGN